LDNLFRNKRILFVFSDPAGAKSILAFSKLKKNIFNEYLILSNRHHPFFSEFDSDVKIISNNIEKLTKVIIKFSPNVIFTATSFPVGIELNCIKIAENLSNLITISFVDHWINFKARFIENEITYFPDIILVLDSRAKEYAQKEGIPVSKLFEFENPYYSYLKLWKSKFSLDQINKIININKKYYLYAPEPLSNFELENKFGFDEFKVLNFIYDNLFKSNLIHEYDFILIYKCHPNQTIKYVESMIRSRCSLVEMKNIIIIDDSIVNINDLIFHSVGVFGIFSNSLIESTLIGKKTAQVIPYLSDSNLNPLKDIKGIVAIKSNLDILNFIND
jgi:hypothetical protein